MRLLVIALLLSGCASHQACGPLAIAFDEAQMAPAWYTEAGEALTVCGHAGAREAAKEKACYAEAWNGYKSAEECEAMK